MKKKGLTIIEVTISFSIAIISIIALYIIVYWGSKVSYINSYYIDANNVMNFIANEIQNNPDLYIQLNSQNNNLEVTSDAEAKIKGKLNLYKYSINGEDNYNIYLQISKLPNNIRLDKLIQLNIILEFYYQNKKNAKIIRNVIFSRYQIEGKAEINVPNNSDIEIP